MNRLHITNKKIVLFISILILILLAVQPVLAAKSKTKVKAKPAPKPKTPIMLTYANPNYKITLNYPSAWEKVPGYKQTIVTFGSPLESKNDLFRENVTITTDTLIGKTTLKEYTDQSLERTRNTQPEYKLVQLAPTKVAGYPAHRAIYGSKYGIYQVKILQVFTVVKGRVYTFTFTAQPDKYDKFLAQAAQIIQSVKIK
ncbi:MAG: DcrB-related protein [Acidobacteriota bacterium]